MKKINRFMIFGVLIAALGTGFWLVRSGTFAKINFAAAKKAVYYCPMHPTYTSDKSGDCPICNMKLVKREPAAESAQPGSKSGDICLLHNCPHIQAGKTCPMLVVAKPGEQVSCPICGTHVTEGKSPLQSKKILYWTDPMIPGYTSDKPGTSPMGMDLVPVYEEETVQTSGPQVEGYAPVLLSPQKQQLIGIQTAPAHKMPMTKTIRTVGRIAYDPDLYQAQQEYLQALESLKKAETGTLPELNEQARNLTDSAKIKLRLLGLNPDLIAEIAASGTPDKSLLYSEPEGTVWLYAPIYEYEIPLVKVGDEIEAEAPAITGKKFTGMIKSIDPIVDPLTRTIRVRAVLQNEAGQLKPEMYVNATLRIRAGEVLAVPQEAVFRTGTENIVFVAAGNGIFEPHKVALGVKSEGFQEIKSGISEGQSVVVSGNFLIDSESRLKASVQASGGGHQHG